MALDGRTPHHNFTGMDHRIIELVEILGVIAVFGGVACYALFHIEIARERAFRLLPKRGSMPGVDEARFARLESAVESIAADVQRISEAQDFQGKLLAGRSAELTPTPDGASRLRSASPPKITDATG